MGLNASFLERLMKEYEWNAFGRVSSLEFDRQYQE